MTCRGRVSNGVVTLEQPNVLPNGAEVQVSVVKARRKSAKVPVEPWRSLLRHAGKGKNLPADLARNHDHYLHGRPKR